MSTDIFGTHRASVSEIRRLLVLCHGLDLSSNHLNDGSSEIGISDVTAEIIHEQMSINLLSLAILLRANFYQGNLKEIAALDVRYGAGLYWLDEYRIVKTTVKDVCDKLVHAESFTKSILPKEICMGAYPSIQLQGKHGKREWVFNICVFMVAEVILKALDQLE